MKVPGMGEVKPVYVWVGAGTVGGIVLYAYYKRRAAQNAAVSAATSGGADSGVADSGVDPVTGLPYSQESGVYGYGAIDPSTGIPYQYESGTVNATTSGNTITSNDEWLSQAEQDATDLFGATYQLASGALGKYLAQTPQGLNDAEYLLVSEVVAELGQPPVHGPYRLIHAPSTPTHPPTPPTPPVQPGGPVIPLPPVGTPPPTPVPPPSASPPPTTGGTNHHVSVTVARWGNPAPWNASMWGIAQHYGYGSNSTNYLPIWNDPMNAGLRAKRGQPTSIQQNDIVWVIPK